MKLSGVYGIVHRASGRAYIGSSYDVFRRWHNHARLLNQGQHHAVALLDAWLLDGPGAFTFVILEPCPREVLAEREQEWLDSFAEPLNTNKSTANWNCEGTTWRAKNPALWRQRLSAARIGKTYGPRDPSVGQKIAAALRGKPLTEERRRHISEARAGRPLTERMRQHLARLHARLRSSPLRFLLRDRTATQEGRTAQQKAHWSRGPAAKEIGERISATKRSRKERKGATSL